MDKNTIIGIVLIFLLFLVWVKINAPTEEQLAEMQRVEDSIALAQQQNMDSLLVTEETPSLPQISDGLQDSLDQLLKQREYGVFAPALDGTSSEQVLENEQVRIVFDTKGGNIKQVRLKQFQKLLEDEEHNDVYEDLYLLEDEKNVFEYILPVSGLRDSEIKTSDLYFTPNLSGNTLALSAKLSNGGSIVQSYTLANDGYDIDYQLQLNGLDQVIDRSKNIQINWVNYLDKLEKSTQYERIYSSVHFKEVGENPSYCSMSGDDDETLEGDVKWVSHSNQFFNSALVATSGSFAGARVESTMIDESEDDLKLLTSQIDLPFQQQTDMKWYIGPNEFETLKSYGYEMEDIIPFGWSVFGTINRWVIRPIFSFLSGLVGSKGIVILLLTLIVKAAVFPLTYKMLHSQSKMGALKPQMAKLREKYKDDQQKIQMETMKIYREYGVNPAGGCFPMILQMPIWFALYRFFPASIEFRQASFLWANDLSSYDVFFRLPIEIPFLGSHISLFTFLWALSMLVYTYYNSKIMDMNSINPMMKYMQYLMPLMFVFFFNSYASGLTCYLLFSNLINITQTVVTKNYLINNDKIMEQLDRNKKKPKKKGGFQARLEQALKEQQRLAAEQQAKKKKK